MDERYNTRSGSRFFLSLVYGNDSGTKWSRMSYGLWTDVPLCCTYGMKRQVSCDKARGVDYA